MKKKFLYITAALLTFGISGCKDDLNIANPNLLTTETFWESTEDAVKGVNAIYSTLHRAPLSRWYHFATTVRSDEGFSISPATDLVNNFDRFIITDYNYGNTVGIYSDCYVGIFRANQVLDNVPDITMDENLKSRLLGEAKFFRGFYYYQLALLFGKVPLMLKTSLPTDLPFPSSQSEVYDQAAKDLTDATTALPPSYSGNDLGRATAGAAHAMLGKVYMQQKKWPEAVAALQPIVEGSLASNYGLMNNYRDNFIAATENNRESVFEFQYETNPADNHDDDTDSRVDNLNYGSSVGRFIAPTPMGFADAQARQWVIDELLQENTVKDPITENPSIQRDTRIDASFLYANTDVRGPNFTSVYGQRWASRYPGGNNNIYFRKFLSDATLNTEVFNGNNNYRYIRYADVLLMYAECLNEVNRTGDAYQYVDRVRDRAGLAPLAVAKPNLQPGLSFLNQLKHERVTELSGEGHRWADLARWGDLSPLLSSRDEGFATFEVGKHELFPLPQLDLDINPNMDASGQNPNY